MEYNIVVLAFEGESRVNFLDPASGPTKAENMLDNVKIWQDQGLYELADAVIATCSPSGDVNIEQTQSLTGKYALGGSGVGLLAGLLLGGPIGGLIGGAAVGAIAGKMKDIGIDDKFIKDVTKGLRPNSSALFLMGKSLDEEKMMEEIKPFKAFVASTTLSDEKERQLQDLLKREE